MRSGQIDRFGAIDDMEGGTTGRYNISVDYHFTEGYDHDFVVQAYMSSYDFKLYSNFTFFLEDSVNGVATGVNRNGVVNTCEITSALWKEIGCRFITHGTILIQAGKRPDMKLDYGDGTCDPVATLFVDGQTKEVRLKRW